MRRGTEEGPRKALVVSFLVRKAARLGMFLLHAGCEQKETQTGTWSRRPQLAPRIPGDCNRPGELEKTLSKMGSLHIFPDLERAGVRCDGFDTLLELDMCSEPLCIARHGMRVPNFGA